MYMFINLLDRSIVEIVDPAIIIIHASTADVHWIYNSVTDLFCIKRDS